MINNESTSKDRGEYGGEQGGYERESSREEYKGGYDPGLLAGCIESWSRGQDPRTGSRKNRSFIARR